MKLARMGDGVEVFYTLQGEGVSLGVPAIFVRLSLCNLHCVWCDTDHTWNFEGTPWLHEKDGLDGYAKHKKEEVVKEMAVIEVAGLVREYNCRRVVFTGGEPLLQEDELLLLVRELRSDGCDWFFEMETNGTRFPCLDLMTELDQLNVSPKLSNSGMDVLLRRKIDILSRLKESGKAWFKFVVRGKDDVEEVKLLVQQVGICWNRIVLMPEGRSVEALDRISLWLADVCKELGCRFSDRLHVRLWGDRRGV